MLGVTPKQVPTLWVAPAKLRTRPECSNIMANRWLLPPGPPSGEVFLHPDRFRVSWINWETTCGLILCLFRVHVRHGHMNSFLNQHLKSPLNPPPRWIAFLGDQYLGWTEI